MNAIRFQTVVEADGVIRPPEGVIVSPGLADVIVLQPAIPAASSEPAAAQGSLGRRLARIAKELDLHGLPVDLAENHDHYVHGLPKGMDNV